MKPQIEMYSEPLSKYVSIIHEAVEGRYKLSGYDLAVIEAALNQLNDYMCESQEEDNICFIPSCNNEKYAFGLCKEHFKRCDG